MWLSFLLLIIQFYLYLKCSESFYSCCRNSRCFIQLPPLQFNPNNKNYEGLPKQFRLEDLKSDQTSFIKTIRHRSTNTFDIGRDELKILSALIKHHMPLLSTSNIAAVISSLGLINEKTKFITTIDRTLISKHLSRILSHNYNPKDMPTLLVGAARLNLYWKDIIPISSDDNIYDSFDNKLVESIRIMNSRSIGDAIWGLGATGAQWIDFSVPLKKALLNRIEVESSNLSLYQLPSILWALAKMGCKWSLLTKLTQLNLSNTLQTLKTELSPTQASKIIWALGGMNYNIKNNMPISFLDTYLLCVNQLKKSKMGFGLSASQVRHLN